MGNLLVVLFLVFIVVGGVFIFTNIFEDEKEENLKVVNPSTGERWDSIKEYRFRNREVLDNG